MKHRPEIVLADKDEIPKYMSRLVDIASYYYPTQFNITKMLKHHLEAGGLLQLAVMDGDIVGFSVSSCETRATPFHKREIPVIYQRLLYVDTTQRRKLLGISLQIAVLRLHLGLFWLFKNFSLFCITDNPLIVRAFGQYNIHYPDTHIAPPPEIFSFCESLLPLLDGTALGKNLLVYGTNESTLKDFDYSSWWEKYLASGNPYYDELLLATAFKTRQDKILHNGTLLLVIGYARRLNFVKRYFQIILKKKS